MIPAMRAIVFARPDLAESRDAAGGGGAAFCTGGEGGEDGCIETG